MIRVIIVFAITRIGITVLSIAPPNDFSHDWYIRLPRWLAIALFFPIRANRFSIISVPMQLCWYGMLILTLLETVLRINTALATLMLYIITFLAVLGCGIYVVHKR